MPEPTWSVSEAADRAGLTPHTLRWYEREGLLGPIGRDPVGRRRYTEADLAWLGLLTRLRRTGMPVRDMGRYAQLARQGEHTVPDRLRLFEAHRERVLGRIAGLQADLAAIDYKIELYGKLVEQQ
ncbi:MAG: MerR family transcriptional regulator [Natronosporangium sp.]